MSYHRYFPENCIDQTTSAQPFLFPSLRMRLDRIEDAGVSRATAQIPVQPNFSFF
jgi:hypothetical protein